MSQSDRSHTPNLICNVLIEFLTLETLCKMVLDRNMTLCFQICSNAEKCWSPFISSCGSCAGSSTAYFAQLVRGLLICLFVLKQFKQNLLEVQNFLFRWQMSPAHSFFLKKIHLLTLSSSVNKSSALFNHGGRLVKGRDREMLVWGEGEREKMFFFRGLPNIALVGLKNNMFTVNVAIIRRHRRQQSCEEQRKIYKDSIIASKAITHQWI